MKRYIVWKRNDGYIHASLYRVPAGWPGADGSLVTFEQLAAFETWEQAEAYIHNRRKEQGEWNGNENSPSETSKIRIR